VTVEGVLLEVEDVFVEGEPSVLVVFDDGRPSVLVVFVDPDHSLELVFRPSPVAVVFAVFVASLFNPCPLVLVVLVPGPEFSVLVVFAVFISPPSVFVVAVFPVFAELVAGRGPPVSSSTRRRRLIIRHPSGESHMFFPLPLPASCWAAMDRTGVGISLSIFEFLHASCEKRV